MTNTWRVRCDSLLEDNLVRTERDLKIEANGTLYWEGKEYIDLSSNFYLGADKRTSEGDYGSSGSRLITGTSAEHLALEQALSEMHLYESAMLFNSGYHANSGAIPSIASDGDLLISDELNHASIIDGCRLSRAERTILKHNDYNMLEAVLKENRSKYRHVWLLCESIFSMDGDCAPLLEYRRICDKYNAELYVDESHAVGVRGAGRGLCHELGIKAELLVGTFAKAYASYGAFVLASEFLVKYLRNTARSYIFSTALPPAVVNFVRQRVEWIQSSDGQEAIRILSSHVSLFRENLGLNPDSTHIVPFGIAGNANVLDASKSLLEKGLMVHGIRSPTVSPGTERLRVSLKSSLSVTDLQKSADAIKEIVDRYDP